MPGLRATISRSSRGAAPVPPPRRCGARVPSQRLDGNTYIDLELDPEPSIGADVAFDDIAVWKPGARSGVSSVASARTIVELDSLQSALRVGDHVIIQRDATLEPFEVTDIGLGTFLLGETPAVAARGAAFSQRHEVDDHSRAAVGLAEPFVQLERSFWNGARGFAHLACADPTQC